MFLAIRYDGACLASNGSIQAIDPGHFPSPNLMPQVASACAIAINDFVQFPNEPEKSSIDVLSPRLNDLGNPAVHISMRKSRTARELPRRDVGSVTDPLLSRNPLPGNNILGRNAI